MIRSIPTITTDRIYCKVRCGGWRGRPLEEPLGLSGRTAICVLTQLMPIASAHEQATHDCHAAAQPTPHHTARLQHAAPTTLCPGQVLGQGAVHGAFAGYTDFTVGLVNT